QGVGAFAIRGRSDAARGAEGSSPRQARTDSVTGSAEHAVHLVSALGQSRVLRADDAGLCSWRPEGSARCPGGAGSRDAIRPCPVPDWDRVAHRIHALALPSWCRVASSGGYECPACVQPNLEEGQFIALTAEVCRSSRSRKATGLGVIRCNDEEVLVLEIVGGALTSPPFLPPSSVS